MDQGVISSFKTKYRRHLINRLLAAIDRNENNLKINILEAIHMASMAWREVTFTTIENCFRKAQFVKEEHEQEPNESQDAEVDRNVWDAIQEQFHFELNFEEYVAVYEGVLTAENMRESEIVDSIKESQELIVLKKKSQMMMMRKMC